MHDNIYDRLARQNGFVTFREWVEHEHTRRRIEEDEYRINAVRLMWGEQEARKYREQTTGAIKVREKRVRRSNR